MTLRTLINIAVSIVIALALIFIARGLAGSIFNVKPPEKPAIAVPAIEAAAPAKNGQKAEEKVKPAPAEDKKAAPAPAPAQKKAAAEPPAPAPAAAAGGDVEAGKKVFKKCKVCHFPDKKKNKIGPYLIGIVGRKVASVEGFKYSDAMKAAAGHLDSWTEDNLKAYLADPRKFIPKNKMSFTGLKKAGDVASVIAYLKTLK